MAKPARARRIGGKSFDAVRIGERRLCQEDRLEQRVAVDDLVRLFELDRFIRRIRRDLVGDQRVFLAEGQDELRQRHAAL